MYAMTVTGPVPAERLGIVLPHEHISCDGSFLCTDPHARDVPLEEVDRAELAAAPMSFLRNLDLREEAVAMAEVEAFVHAGGSTLVEVTPVMGDSRDPEQLVRVSRQTGANVIMGSGWYVGAAHPPELERLSIDALADLMVGEVERGRGTGGVRPGVLGEIGTGDPLLPAEERVLRAAGRAHLRTGCPINVHMAAGCRVVMDVLDALEDEGLADFGRVVISHMDVAIDLPQQREVAARGAMVEYDTFGHEHYPDSRGYRMPSDATRLSAIATLADEGLIESILISQDVCLRSLWRHYGGRGYAGLLGPVRERAAAIGITAAQWDTLVRDNPAQVFAYLPATAIDA